MTGEVLAQAEAWIEFDVKDRRREEGEGRGTSMRDAALALEVFRGIHMSSSDLKDECFLFHLEVEEVEQTGMGVDKPTAHDGIQ